MRVYLYLVSLVLCVMISSPVGAWQNNTYQTIDASGHMSASSYQADGKLLKVTDGTGKSTVVGTRVPSISRTITEPTEHINLALSGTIIHVPADHPTIQAAINAANNGDTVLVSDGTYRENISFSGKAITVTSVNGPATTIIDGGAVNSVVTFSTGEGSGSVLSGFTIQNGGPNFSGPNFGDGGGIFISSASPSITGNVITNNKGCEGIGIYSQFGSPLIQGNTISNNAQSGCTGGIGGGGIAIDGSSAPQIIGNAIFNNSLLQGADGAGISLFAAGAPVIRNNIIHDNSTGSGGGGLAMANDASPQIVDNLFFNNKAAQGGGIYWVIPTSSPGMVLLNNTMVANSSGSGSAIFDGGFDTNMALQNNLIIGATGQAAYFCNQLNGSTTPATFANNDVFSNGAAAFSGNCTVATGSNGNISSDPLFVTGALNNFRLQPSSPAIDAGNNNARIPLPATDLDGDPRIFNNTVDIGAFEFQTTTTSYSATSLTFAPIPVGTTSALQTVTISNTGSIALQIVPLSLSGDFSETDNCSSSTGIAAGQGCTVTVSFTPSAVGVRTGQVTIISNDAAGSTVIHFSGTGGVPAVTLSSISLAFGNQPVNTTSSPQSVTLTNSGSGPLTITSIAASGNFSQTNSCGAQVAPGANCTITVTFTPSAIGASSGAITISDNAAGSPQMISLTGTGTAAIAVLSATSLSFGDQPVSTAGAAQNVTLTNNGNAVLTISGITIAGANSADFSQINNCGSSLAPAGSCSISVVFTPSGSGSRSAILAITDNAAGSPQTVALSGTGTDFSITASPSSLSIQRKSSKSSTITLTPVSGFNQTVGLSCSGTPANTTCSVSPTAVTLNGTSASTAQLTVTTTGKTPFGTFNVVISGTSGVLTHTTTVKVTVP